MKLWGTLGCQKNENMDTQHWPDALLPGGSSSSDKHLVALNDALGLYTRVLSHSNSLVQATEGLKVMLLYTTKPGQIRINDMYALFVCWS